MYIGHKMGCLIHCLFILLLIPLYLGYDRILEFDSGDCDTYEFYDMTQYQSYLVNWNGSPFNFWCNVAFHGENDENVATDYRVCFKVLAWRLDDCDVKVRFFDGLLTDVSETYDCNRDLPDKWCTKNKNYGKIRIDADKRSNSKLEIEVTVTAGTSLTIVAAVLIAFGILVALGIAITVCIVWSCNRGTNKPSTGTVISTGQRQGNQSTQSQQLVGYATQQTEMVPAGRGLYRPHEVTVQHSVMVPSNGQPQTTYTSQNNVYPPTQTNANSQSQQQQNSNPTAYGSPPSYESVAQYEYGKELSHI